MECNFQTHDGNFLSKNPKNIFTAFKNWQKSIFFKNRVLLKKKLSGHLKCSFDKSAERYFAKSAMAIAQNPEKDFGEIYFSKKIGIILANVP